MIDHVKAPWQLPSLKPDSYDELLKGFGEVIHREDVGDYQGDLLFFLWNIHHGFGFLNQCYGSCSGCDALQACESFDEFERLRAQMWDEVRWFASKEEIVSFLRAKDWEGTHLVFRDGIDGFIGRVASIIEAYNGPGGTP